MDMMFRLGLRFSRFSLFIIVGHFKDRFGLFSRFIKNIFNCLVICWTAFVVRATSTMQLARCCDHLQSCRDALGHNVTR